MSFLFMYLFYVRHLFPDMLTHSIFHKMNVFMYCIRLNIIHKQTLLIHIHQRFSILYIATITTLDERENLKDVEHKVRYIDIQ